jgi:hypothetical protein
MKNGGINNQHIGISRHVKKLAQRNGGNGGRRQRISAAKRERKLKYNKNGVANGSASGANASALGNEIMKNQRNGEIMAKWRHQQWRRRGVSAAAAKWRRQWRIGVAPARRRNGGGIES